MNTGKYIIQQLYPAYNLKTNENRQRAESCEILLLIEFSSPVTEKEVMLACREDRSNVPKLYLGMQLQAINITERIDARHWKASASYLYRYPANRISTETVPPEKVSIDYSTSTAKRTVSYKTVKRYGNMPDYGGLIDVQDDGSGNMIPNGVEVLVPSGTLTITHYFKPKEWTTKLRNKIAYRRCRTNSHPFRGFETGELLFTGENVDFSDKDGFISVQFHFLISQNSDDIVVGNETDIEKKGWEAIWVKYKKVITTHEGKTVQVLQPDGVAVEKVYKSADFSEMGISKSESLIDYSQIWEKR